MKTEIHILMLEDNVADADLIRFALREGGLVFSLRRVEAKTTFLKELAENTPDLLSASSAAELCRPPGPAVSAWSAPVTVRARVPVPDRVKPRLSRQSNPSSVPVVVEPPPS